MKRCVIVGCLMLAGGFTACAVSYEPARVSHARPLTSGDFEQVADVLRSRYGGLVVSDRDSFRLQTGWSLFQRGSTPGARRATVYRDDDKQLRVLVEVRYTRLGYGGLPEVTPVAGDLRAEEELAGVLERALANQPEV